jgi:hypothetical protein
MHGTHDTTLLLSYRIHLAIYPLHLPRVCALESCYLRFCGNFHLTLALEASQKTENQPCMLDR